MTTRSEDARRQCQAYRISAGAFMYRTFFLEASSVAERVRARVVKLEAQIDKQSEC